MLFRHLAAAVLPLAATAAGVLAVGLAVQMPRGPSSAVAVPGVVLPGQPAAEVVASPARKPGHEGSRVAPSVARISSPPPAAVGQPTADHAPSPIAPKHATVSIGRVRPSLPRPATKPVPAEEAAPLTPPVAATTPSTQAPAPAPTTETATVATADPQTSPVRSSSLHVVASVSVQPVDPGPDTDCSGKGTEPACAKPPKPTKQPNKSFPKAPTATAPADGAPAPAPPPAGADPTGGKKDDPKAAPPAVDPGQGPGKGNQGGGPQGEKGGGKDSGKHG